MDVAVCRALDARAGTLLRVGRNGVTEQLVVQ